MLRTSPHVDVPVKIQHDGGPNLECRSAIRHSVRRFVVPRHYSGSHRAQESGGRELGSLLLGFCDWGSWWQGEIAGEYFISNSNLKSPQIRARDA
jgi:hypothetical protein